MAPEQLRESSVALGPPVDLWALGLVAFKLLTGEVYWNAESLLDVVLAITVDPMPAPTQRAPSLPPAFDAWFARACNREPGARGDVDATPCVGRDAEIRWLLDLWEQASGGAGQIVIVAGGGRPGAARANADLHWRERRAAVRARARSGRSTALPRSNRSTPSIGACSPPPSLP
ncbi:hypothetical protein [Sorangium sp. So ce1153]|uniref:hypothetical protein n=1 Tax=Sorangium sp. So ce1153 TaxID=3133333 RepID=UPI003F5D7F31